VQVLCNFLYIWCLYNVSATAFNLPTGQALKNAFVMWACFLVIMTVGSFVFFLFARILGLILAVRAMM
jgi:hypothetical protein